MASTTHFLLPKTKTKTTMSGPNNTNPLERDIALYLESILADIKLAINTGEWDPVRRYIAPEFTCEPVFRPCATDQDVSQGLCGLEEYIKMCRSVLPAMQTEIVNVVTDVDVRHGRAASFTTFRTVGELLYFYCHEWPAVCWRLFAFENIIY